MNSLASGYLNYLGQLFPILSLVALLSIAGWVSGWWLAPRVGMNRVIWSIFLFIPIFNVFAGMIFGIVLMAKILDLLNDIAIRVRWRWDETHDTRLEGTPTG